MSCVLAYVTLPERRVARMQGLAQSDLEMFMTMSP